MLHSSMNKQYLLLYLWGFFCYFNDDKIEIYIEYIYIEIPEYMAYHEALQFCIFSWLKNKLQKILTTHRDHLDMLLLQKIEHYTNY